MGHYCSYYLLPGQDGEHPKSEYTGGFDHSDGSPCSSHLSQVVQTPLLVLPVDVWYSTTTPVTWTASGWRRDEDEIE